VAGTAIDHRTSAVTQDYILIPDWWRRAASAARLLVAAGCLLAGWQAAPGLPRSVLMLFLGYSVALLVLKGGRRPSYASLTLLIDTLFFALAGWRYGFWPAAIFQGYLMASAALFHQWPQVAAVGGMTVTLCLLLQPAGMTTLAACFLLTGTLTLLLTLSRSRMERNLFQAIRQMTAARAEAGRARAAEAERIAGDFHDGPLQIFMGVQVRLQVVRKMLERNITSGLREMVQVQELLKSQMGELRIFYQRMLSVEVEAGTGEFTASVSRLLEVFQKDTGIQTSFAGSGTLEGQPTELATELVQIVQEALHNVRKHSGAHRVSVAIERVNGNVHLQIGDDGGGFPFGGSFTLAELDLLCLGPESIKRRVRAVHGDLTVESLPGRGANLKIRVPL